MDNTFSIPGRASDAGPEVWYREEDERGMPDWEADSQTEDE